MQAGGHAAPPPCRNQFDSNQPLGQLLKRVLDDNDVARAVRRVAHEIVEGNRGADDIVLIGIPTRGVPLAERVGGEIAAIEGVAVPVGTLDIGAYRDDLATRQVQDADRTDIGVPIDGRTVVLVDDVLYTGRTVRAALDALADVGRPARIQLAVLVDRGHRELPIRADYVGKNLPTSENERVTVHLTEADADEGVWIEERRS